MNSNKVFWIFQSAFWSIYYLYNILVVHYSSFFRGDASASLLLIYLFLMCFFGIPLGLLAKKIYEKINYRSISMPALIFSVIVVSVFLAHIWLLETMLLDRIFNELVARLGVRSITFIPLKMRVYLYFWEIFISSLLMVAWISIYLFLKFWQEWNRQQFEIEKANLQLENAQLKILRSQISPHFLFNSLSSLRALIRSNPPKAEHMLTQISEFLRYSLVTKTDRELPLKEELAAMKNYLAIEKIRFEDKLNVSYNIEEATTEFPVPGFILHPLVENAVKHGMNSSDMPLQIWINSKLENKSLVVDIINTGRWLDEIDGDNGTATGLENVKSRLRTMYPERSMLSINATRETVNTTLTIKARRTDGQNL